jgi:hypothetical protein
VAFLMQARASGDTISAGGNTALMWSGSAGAYGRVDWLGAPP